LTFETPFHRSCDLSTSRQCAEFQIKIIDAIRLMPDYTNAYINRGINYLSQGNNTLGCSDAQKACALGNCKLLEMAGGRGVCP
jgi:hypothetical protein